jgi:hypothetical protein
MQRPSSYKTSNHFRTLWFVVSISTLLTLSMAQGDTTDARYKDLGHRLICTCDSEPAAGMGQRAGCKQVLLECSHVDCEPSKHIRSELSDALRKGDSDDVILHSFVKNYGADVLEQSSPVANKLIWALALAALTSITIALVRKRKPRPASSSMPLSDLEDVDFLRDRVLRETERDDW